MGTLLCAGVLLVFTTIMSEGKPPVEFKAESRHLGASRLVRVHLPPSYERETRRRYPVLYLHDGQNVFSSAEEHCCFGWGNWELDITADRLVAEGRMREVILVAVDNSRSRYKEYRGRLQPGPEAAKTRKPATNSLDNARCDAYAKFLVEELKPRIDREFRTLKGASNTGVLGSSMGGIASVALAWDYPKTFGLAASLSGAFQVEKRNFLERVLREHKKRSNPFRCYLDSGVIDYTGDDDGRKDTEAVAAELRRLGWKDGKNFLHYTDPRPLTDEELGRTTLPRAKWSEARGSQHNEFYWKLRAWRALEFLFPPARNG